MTDQVWEEACLKELGALSENETFSLVSLHAGKKAVGCRWVFTTKDGPTGGFPKYRLVAQGFTQQKGIDYNKTFSPVIQNESVRVIFGVAA